jgi:hypothetical protein
MCSARATKLAALSRKPVARIMRKSSLLARRATNGVKTSTGRARIKIRSPLSVAVNPSTPCTYCGNMTVGPKMTIPITTRQRPEAHVAVAEDAQVDDRVLGAAQFPQDEEPPSPERTRPRP